MLREGEDDFSPKYKMHINVNYVLRKWTFRNLQMVVQNLPLVHYLITYWLTHSMERSPSWETNRF